ncbi:winged helix-turn-helix transcriptional regulator [Streptomyces sp. TRM66268-LWL]|uniref:Winged helix-turn-helix transcriptional regulator n=1 Tax=Streptomyces polyasparticus TaxID=2767826 RepID=A0ABR7S9W1_9ACTN|nr:DUF5937 family protein [Streptomyces polyasparticus]MBC9711402.1 winged helix-turn-helix transcriptional regulator [Streptomyces polyasparticus]
MPFHLHFGEHDLLHCRFAISPIWETQSAIRTLIRPDSHGYHLPWLRRIKEKAEGLDLAPALLLIPQRGRSPDFWAPPPTGALATFEEEIERVRATPAEVAYTDLYLTLVERPGALESPLGRRMLDDPAAAVQLLADCLEQAWHVLIAPDWPRLRALLEADIAYHSRVLAAVGFRAMLGELNPNLRWHGSTLTIVSSLGEYERELHGEGLVLMPSVFTWPDVASGQDEPWQPAVIYPARGIGGLWSEGGARTPEALARLLGRARADVLCALADPASTSALAGRLGLAPSSVSAHLSALKGAGLLASRRYGHQVLYERTPLGIALAGAEGLAASEG